MDVWKVIDGGALFVTDFTTLVPYLPKGDCSAYLDPISKQLTVICEYFSFEGFRHAVRLLLPTTWNNRFDWNFITVYAYTRDGRLLSAFYGHYGIGTFIPLPRYLNDHSWIRFKLLPILKALGEDVTYEELINKYLDGTLPEYIEKVFKEKGGIAPADIMTFIRMYDFSQNYMWGGLGKFLVTAGEIIGMSELAKIGKKILKGEKLTYKDIVKLEEKLEKMLVNPAKIEEIVEKSKLYKGTMMGTSG